MRILLLTQLFQPEPNHLKGLAFAEELIKSGHEVEVLTGFPNYPGGQVYPGYKIKWFCREELHGVPVVRVAHYPSHDRSGLRRFANYTSFALSAGLFGCLLVKRPDVVHVYQGPATLVFPALLINLMFRAPFVLDIQDVWPDSVTASGMLKPPWLLRLINGWCRLSYRWAGKIIVLSNGYKTLLVKRGVPEDKIEVVVNWCDENQIFSPFNQQAVRDKFGIGDHFNVVFAGTMGKVQALEAVIRAAVMLQDEQPRIRFLFIGGGVEVEQLRAMVSACGLTNVRFIPRQPAHEIGGFLAIADVLLIHLKQDPLGLIGIPQKTQAYMAAGKPILMAVCGEAAQLVEQAGAGLICEPENPRSIADAALQLFAMTPGERAHLGENGRRFYEDRLAFGKGMRRMLSVLEGTVAKQAVIE
jgi:colanic acid biosynthesis glycosyl transferase WcaI